VEIAYVSFYGEKAERAGRWPGSEEYGKLVFFIIRFFIPVRIFFVPGINA
jgi:hypothetical protein